MLCDPSFENAEDFSVMVKRKTETMHVAKMRNRRVGRWVMEEEEEKGRIGTDGSHEAGYARAV